jgi:N-acylneuraminate cytidylyltransferase
MTFLALVPARGGSKRLPGKNIRPLGGRPLISWTIELAARIGVSADVLVSTDDREIADVSAAAGAWVPWLRPEHLASDTASSVDVALHALDYYEAARKPVDGLILLQPTSPFRRLSTVLDGMRKFEANGGAPVLGVSPATTHPALCFKLRDDRLAPYHEGSVATRSQDLPPAFEVNGVLYIVSPDQLRTERTFFPENVAPLLMDDEIEALDIDTQWDWLCAEKALESGMMTFEDRHLPR